MERSKDKMPRGRTRAVLLGTTVFAGLGAALLASAPAAAQETAPVESVTVSGYRASLQASADAKRETINFSDSIFAEDIGKFPDNNLAEAINRIPGIQLSRNVAGEGQQISIRGLGTSFTHVLLNGNQVAVASGGVTRAVDLDLFPVELFSKINVTKTADAHTTEGGVAGTVNIVNVRPFDNPESGFHLSYSLQDGYAESGHTMSPRGAIIASDTWNNTFGVLVGVAAQHFKYRVDGYENVGTDIVGIVDQQAALGRPVCPASLCGLNTTASKNYHWASVVPVGITAADAAKYGLGAPGTPYAYAGPSFNTTDFTTPGGTSGLSVQQLSNAIFPHLPRFDLREGFNDRLSVLTALEYRPSNNLHFNLDFLYEHTKYFQHLVDDEQFNRQSCNVQGTAGAAINGVPLNDCQIPVNVKLDSNNIVTSATALNSAWFMDNTENTDRLDLFNINPSVEWQINDWAKVDANVYFDDSHFNHEQISLIIATPGDGLSTTYNVAPGSDFPLMTTNAPLNSVNGWQWYITRAQPSRLTTITDGAHVDLTFGDDKANIRMGYAYDKQYRNQINYGANQNLNNCIGVTTSAAFPCTLPDGTARANGTAPLIPNSAISQYLIPGPSDFLGLSGQPTGAFGQWVMADLTKIMGATRIQEFQSDRNTTVQSPGGGSFNEQNNGFYVEANGATKFLEHDIRFNAGVRYVNTAQMLTAPLFLAGGVQTAVTKRVYDAVLPSLNVSANITDDIIVRMAGARTMTRAAPGSMLPGSSFPTATLSPLNAGNPDLQPYFSDNVDLGVEWYTGGPGVIAINGFSKDISNFTTAQARQAAFGTLGIPTASLTPTQLAEYNANGMGADVITVNSQGNLQQKLHIRGFEAQIVQPLDFLLEGIGVQGTYTRVQQNVDPGLTANVAQSIATGIAPYSYNFGLYWEGYGASIHVTYNYLAGFVNTPSPAYSGIPQAQYTEPHRQIDLASSYTIPWFDGTVLEGAQITFDAINLNNEKYLQYVGDRNSTVQVGYPGPTFLLGFRGKF